MAEAALLMITGLPNGPDNSEKNVRTLCSRATYSSALARTVYGTSISMAASQKGKTYKV
ncbi:hypothetical protein D3C76_737730 [compost metagenome]